MKDEEIEDFLCADCDVACGLDRCNAWFVVKKFAPILDPDKIRELIQEK